MAMTEERQFIDFIKTNKLSQAQIKNALDRHVKFKKISDGLIRSNGFQFEYRYGGVKQLRLLGQDDIVLHNPKAYGLTEDTAKLLMNIINHKMFNEMGVS